MILFLLAAAAAAWWFWGRGLSRQQLMAAGSAIAGLLLFTKGAWMVALPMFLPAIWLFMQPASAPAAPSASPPPQMDMDEARRVLGVAPGADVDAIRAAHRRLVAKVHPDQGGSAELAGRVNAARDILLAELQTR
ncbi:MAG: DnaJ domain-containing protein [Pseudomonadota bacterium]